VGGFVAGGEAGARNGSSRSTICAGAPSVAAAKAQVRDAMPISDLRFSISNFSRVAALSASLPRMERPLNRHHPCCLLAHDFG
jgi:hypothetical protein